MKLILLLISGIILSFFIISSNGLKHKYASAEVSTGKIKGYVIEPNPNRTNAVNVFKGIPYAEPPVGKLRFALPKPVKPWKGIWNATFYKAACPSNTTATTSPQKVTHEDCLYLNIFADQICMTKKCPVLYIVHGGNFYYDSAVMFNDDFIIQNYASKGMIVVIPAYRLGVFGFLDLGSDDTVPRNIAIHDLVASLHWVQNEIHAFGGNPKKVTIFGNSAGGSAVSFLSAAPNVPLLWSQAFISSPNCVMMENKMVPQTVAVLERAGCLYASNNTNTTLPAPKQVECLRKLDWKQLIGIQRDIEDQDMLFNGVEPDNYLFNDKTFTQLLSQYKAVPTVIGTTTEEFKSEPDDVAYYCDKYVKIFDYHEDATVQACIDKYADVMDENGNIPVVPDMVRAEIFRISMQIMRKKNPVWLYSWELENHLYHTGDVSFLVGLHPIDPKNATWKEKRMLKYMPTVLHNFVTKGFPDEEWIKFTSYGENFEVLDFTNSTRTVRGPHPIFDKWYPEAVAFWLGELAAIDKHAKRMRHGNESKEKWDVVSDEAREDQWQRFKNELNETKQRLKDWTMRRRDQWEKIREKNENEYAEKVRNIRERDEAKNQQHESGIRLFGNLLLAQSLKETEETLKAKRRQMDNSQDDEGVETIDHMLDNVKDWKEAMGDDEDKMRWKQKNMPPMHKHKEEKDDHREEKKDDHHHEDWHRHGGDSEEEYRKSHRNNDEDPYKGSHDLDKLSPEEKDAAKAIFHEQEEALNRQRNMSNPRHNATIIVPTVGGIYTSTNPSIAKKINNTIDDVRDKLKESNPGLNDSETSNKNATDAKKKVDEAKKELEKERQKASDNLTDKSKDVLDSLKDRQKKRNETLDKFKEDAKNVKNDVEEKWNNTKADVAKKWNDTVNDVGKKVNETKEDVANKIGDASDDIRNKLNETAKETNEQKAEVKKEWDKIIEDENNKDAKKKDEKVIDMKDETSKRRESEWDRWHERQEDREEAREAATDDWKAKKHDSSEEKTEDKIETAKNAYQKAQKAMDKDIEKKKEAAKAAVESWKNAIYQRFQERQKMKEKYQEFVDYLRREALEDIFDKLRDLINHSKNQNKLPPPNAKIIDYLRNHTHSRQRKDWQNSELFSPISFLAIPDFQLPSSIDDAEINSNTQNGYEIRQVWSAFWVITTISMLLAFVLCINAVMQCMKPQRPFQGYYYNEDSGFFNEKSKIVIASQYPNYS